MSSQVEYELTFLAKHLPTAISSLQPTAMIDIYVPDSPKAHSRLRLRKKGDRFEITKKTPVNLNDASTHNEVSIELDSAEFECLSVASSKRIRKDRYTTTYNGIKMEVDVFKDGLEGLVTIDFEFNSLDAMRQFSPPDFCLADITQENFIAGGVLAGKGFDDIAGHLEKFGYHRINNAISD